MNQFLFSFDELANGGEKAIKEVTRLFTRAGAQVIQASVDTTIKRTSNISYRQLHLSFADSQQITLRIKRSGDIFQVLFNKSVIPIRYQDDHEKAIAELVNKLEGNRSAFQKRLARLSVKLPASIKTAIPQQIDLLRARRDELKQLIQEVKTLITATQQEIIQLNTA